MKFRTTIEIDITGNSKPSEQDVQEFLLDYEEIDK